MTDLFGNETEEPRPVSRRRDWTGNSKGVFSCIGASNHSLMERVENDFYATPPEAVEMLCERESFSTIILEPCCGLGHIAKVFERRGHTVIARDLVDRGYGIGGQDFLKCGDHALDADVVTNPPYSMAREFVEKSLGVIADGHKVAMFLKLTFLEGKARRRLFERHPPRTVYISSSRLSCGRNGTDFIPSCIAYAWFVWEKGFRGEPVIRWFN